MSGNKNNLSVASEHMKAAVYYNYGSPDGISIASVAKPAPKAGEVTLKIMAASVNAYDWHLLRAKPFFTRFMSGVFKPKNNILGADVAGVVIASESETARFKPGDRVYGCLESCGKGGLAAGGFAEYVCAKESVLAPIPNGATFEEAAALPMAAVTALQGLRDNGRLKSGQSVLINGASGGVGAFAAQIATAFGAEVTGVCGSGGADMLRSFGVKHVIDYTREDFADNGRNYDLILDVAANRSVRDYRRALKPNGICVVIGFSTVGNMIRVAFAGKRDGKTICILAANNKNSGDLLELNKLVEIGKLKPVIDSRYSLNETAEAIRRIENGHPKGKVIINIGGME
jgi:NADPH:quinone reductase-like Zn-dependent oxidoreductase